MGVPSCIAEELLLQDDMVLEATQMTKWNNNPKINNPDRHGEGRTDSTPDPAEYTSDLDLTINNKALPMATNPKVLGLTLDPDPKLTYSTHIHNISVHAHKPLQIIKALTATGWGKQKETLMATYKAAMGPGSGVCLFHMVTSCILEQHQQTASHAECSIENCHRMHTRHKHITSA